MLLNFFMVGLPFSPIVKSVFVGGKKVVCCVQSGSVVLLNYCQFVLLCLGESMSCYEISVSICVMACLTIAVVCYRLAGYGVSQQGWILIWS